MSNFKNLSKLLRRGKQLDKCREGSATLEFAMLSPLFIGLLFSIFEASLYFYSTSVAEEAVSRASRLIRTGQAIVASDPSAQGACTAEKDCFFEEVCDLMKSFGDCSANLSVDVTRFSSWSDLNSDLSTVSCPSSDGYNYDDQGFDRGAQLDIIRVRVCYIIDMINPALGMSLAETEDGKRALISTYVFRNEPYDEGLDGEERPS